MSRISTLKRKDINFSKSALIMGCAFIMALSLSQKAAADPDKKPVMDDVQKIEETVDTAEDIMDAQTPIELPRAAEDTVDTEGTPDIIAPPAMPEMTPNAQDVIEDASEAVDEAVETTEVVGALSETKIEAPAPAPLSTDCYPQQDGSSECICDGEEDCAALKLSDECTPGTDWSNENGLGGCTKKKD